MANFIPYIDQKSIYQKFELKKSWFWSFLMGLIG